MLGTLRTLTKRQVPFLVALRGAGYGVVQGAMEGGLSAAEASTEALEAARQAARELGVPSLAADTALATGMLEAAEASGEDALLEVREALAAEQVTIVQPVADANTGEPDAGEQGSGD